MYTKAQEIAKQAQASRSERKAQKLENAMVRIRAAADNGLMKVRIMGTSDELLMEALRDEGFEAKSGSYWDQRDGTYEAWVDVSWGHAGEPKPR